MMKNVFYWLVSISLFTLISTCQAESDTNMLRKNFMTPPDSARPGVYWYFMDGNLSKEGMTKDLESMKKVGIGSNHHLPKYLPYDRYPEQSDKVNSCGLVLPSKDEEFPWSL